jgi:hypothetical protein
MHLAIIKNQGPIVFFFSLGTDDALSTIILFLKARNKSLSTIHNLLVRL